MKCKYTFPVTGRVKSDKFNAILVDDLLFEFELNKESFLSKVIVTFPVPPAPEKRNAPDMNETGGDYLSVHEPRAAEIEEIILQFAIGLSMAPTGSKESIDILFDSRKIEWINDSESEENVSNVTVNFDGRLYDRHRVKQIPFKMFTRALITARVVGRHDVALTFYKRGVVDSHAHHYIEAFYNFFFFFEYLYGNGKSGKTQLVKEFLKSSEFMDTIVKVLTEKIFSAIIPSDLVLFFSGMDPAEFLTHIVTIRGRLHHPNKNRVRDWNPEKQRDFASETIILHFICIEIATRRYFTQATSEEVNRGCQQVERFLRLGEPIQVTLNTAP